MTTRRGTLVVLSAPSGSGKTTVVQQVLASVEELEFSVSYTTRPRRSTEREGVDYRFISDPEFRAKIARNEFLEWAEVHGHLYGTGRAETEAVCRRGRDILLDVDVQGAEQVRRAVPDAVTIFMLPPSFEVLEQRLRGRSEDDPASVAIRLRAARGEVDRCKDYDYVIINEDVDGSTAILRAIIVAERARPSRLNPLIQPILDSFK